MRIVANWSMPSIPRAIGTDQVRQLLASIDRRSAIGRRNYAIVLLLARLGLRSGEVAFLELEDIDWDVGQVSVSSKRGQRTTLPLPADVGAAVAAYESSYYLSPQEGGEKPYALVCAAMRRKNVVGIARIVRSGREHICVIRPYEHGMVLQALFWNDEVRPMAFPVLPAISEAETAIAEQLVDALAGKWEPDKYSDTYRTNLLKLIEAKREGQQVTATSPKPAPKAQVIDIASALQASLAAAKAKKETGVINAS